MRKWSPQAEAIFGWREEEVLGKHWREFPKVFEADLERVAREVGNFQRRDRFVVANRNYRKDGTVIHCEWYNSVLAGEAGVTSMLSQVQDVTARVRAEAERVRLEAQMQHTQKLESLGVLAGGIAHDFNNLLVGILGNADMALMALPQESSAREHIQDLVTSAQHAAELCKQMLAYSGKGRFVVEPVNLNEVLLELKNLVFASISKRAALQFHLEESLPCIEADTSQVRQVLMNLLINASDAIGDGDGIISISTALVEDVRPYRHVAYMEEPLEGKAYAKVEVRDTGCGMDAETLQKIFDPFFTTKFTGRGLGLAAVLGIVRGHRGAIAVSSTPGAGTVVTLLFPILGRPAPVAAAAPTPEAPAARGEGLVLVVDDEEMVRMVAQRALEKAGYTVICACNGQQAVDFAREHKQELRAILLDMTMPVMSGHEALREIRNAEVHAPVLLTSGYTEEETRRRVGSDGYTGFLQKPFRAQDLLEGIRGAIAGSASYPA